MSENKLINKNSKYPNTYYRVSLKGIIKNDNGEILMVKEYDSTSWNLPGGGLDHGETEKEALAREFLEEICYKGNFTATPVVTMPFWLESKQAWLLWIVYEISTENFDFNVGSDCSEIAFIDPLSLKGSVAPEEKWIYEYFSR